MSTRLHARRGQAPTVGRPRKRPARPESPRFQPLALLALVGAICVTAGYFDGLIAW